MKEIQEKTSELNKLKSVLEQRIKNPPSMIKSDLLSSAVTIASEAASAYHKQPIVENSVISESSASQTAVTVVITSPDDNNPVDISVDVGSKSPGVLEQSPDAALLQIPIAELQSNIKSIEECLDLCRENWKLVAQEKIDISSRLSFLETTAGKNIMNWMLFVQNILWPVSDADRERSRPLESGDASPAISEAIQLAKKYNIDHPDVQCIIEELEVLCWQYRGLKMLCSPPTSKMIKSFVRSGFCKRYQTEKTVKYFQNLLTRIR